MTSPGCHRSLRTRRSLPGRLENLERFYEAAIAARQQPNRQERADAAIVKVREIIASRGVVQQQSESLFDALARALGMTSRDLRAYLKRRAFGES